MSTKRPSLSRGLGALLGQPEPDAESAVVTRAAAGRRGTAEAAGGLATARQVSAAHRPAAGNTAGAGGLDQSAGRGAADRRASARTRTAGKPSHVRYEIIAGERRWRAAQLAGLHEIPGSHPSRARRSRHRDGAHREHPARGPQSAGRSARAAAPDQRIRHDARDRRGSGRSFARRRVQSAAAAGSHRRSEDAGRASRAGDGSRARAARRSTTKRQQAEVGAQVAQKKLSVRETEALVKRLASRRRRQRRERSRAARRSEHPQAGSRAQRKARRQGRRCSTPRRAKASSSSAITPWMSSTAFSNIYADRRATIGGPSHLRWFGQHAPVARRLVKMRAAHC